MGKSRASLFLMEIMISILFFSISAMVCIQLFVKAHTLNIQTENLSKATLIAQDLSEYYLHGDPAGDSSMYQQMLTYLPNYSTAKNHIVVYYNENWTVCKQDSATFTATLTFHEDADFSYLSIDISDMNEDKSIYTSSVKKHIPRRLA